MSLPRYVVLDKAVGETPLQCAEAWRTRSGVPEGVPLAYAGRLDPMASGKLLILIGEECKQQTAYHKLDKEYDFSVLVGIGSDTGDVLGVVSEAVSKQETATDWQKLAASFCGAITLPYPHYSARTVKGKPLHTWAVMGRLDHITIPLKASVIYTLTVRGQETSTRAEVVAHALEKVSLLPTVTDPRKALGNDFRRPAVHAAWEAVRTAGCPDDLFSIVHFRCIASSGTYMRSLAEAIATKAGTSGLAFSIHRRIIGKYVPLAWGFGWWQQRYR